MGLRSQATEWANFDVEIKPRSQELQTEVLKHLTLADRGLILFPTSGRLVIVKFVLWVNKEIDNLHY